MKFQRIFIWVVAFTLAFFTGRTVIRNLWRLYYTPFQKALIIQNNNSTGYSGIIFNRHNKTGRFGDYHFRWKYYWWKNRIRLIGQDASSKSLDGMYSITVSDNEESFVLKGNGRSIIRVNPKLRGIVNKMAFEDWEMNRKIPWF